MTEEPRLFWCICCEEYHLLGQIQKNGLCKQCDDMVKRWEKPWEPSWGLILFLGVMAGIIWSIPTGG